MHENQFLEKFTKLFLKEFYGTCKYFKIEAIVKSSRKYIISRINEYDKYIDDNYRVIEYLLHDIATIDKLVDDNLNKETEKFILLLEKSFITDLFKVASIPIKYINKFNSETKLSDELFGSWEIIINLKFNLYLLQWAWCQKHGIDYTWDI